VPQLIAKKHISEGEVINHALKSAVDKNYKLLIEDKEFQSEELIEDAVSIDFGKVEPKTLEIIYLFEKYPTVTLGDYKKIKINYEEPKVEKQEVENEIGRYTKKDTMLIPKEEGNIDKGDMVNFDFKGFVNDKAFAGGEAKGHELEIGSNTFIPGFEEQMVGLKKGEKKTIEVTFPKDYQAKDLAGKKAKFELVINDIKTIQKPKLDEAYIARFAIPNVKTEEEFREYIGKQLLEYKKYHNKQGATRQISE
jgi:trigger factor